MMRMTAVLAATAGGAAVGWVCGLVPVPPVVRVAAASALGVFVGATVSGTVLYYRACNAPTPAGLAPSRSAPPTSFFSALRLRRGETRHAD